MGSPVDVKKLAERMEETVSRLNQIEHRMSRLEVSMDRAVQIIMPKMETHQREQRDESASSSHCQTSSADPVPSTSLLQAAERGDAETLLQILGDELIYKRNAQQRTKDGDTALHVAASRGHLKAVVVLLGAVKVDTPGHRMRTPLHCAAAHGHLRVAQRLLDIGAQVDAKDANDSTALDMAAEKAYLDVIALLVQNGARSKEETVLMAASQDRWSFVQLFLQDGISVDLCNKKGDTLLMQAARAGRWDAVEMLLKRGATPTKCKDPRECALVLAAKNGQVDSVRLLLRCGAASDSEQVKFGVGNAKSGSVVWTFVEVVPYAVKGLAGKWGLVQAGCTGRLEPLVALLEAGVHIDAMDGANQTALWLAAANGHVACVKELLRRGADIHAKDVNGDTPLHRASMNGRLESLRVLLAAGASTTERNNDGKTPMHVADSSAVRQMFTVNR